MKSPKALSDRAKHRLRLAAGFLRTEGHKLDCPRDQFYEKIQEVLGGLSDAHQKALKSLVDWVEAYDLNDQNTESRQLPASRKAT